MGVPIYDTTNVRSDTLIVERRSMTNAPSPAAAPKRRDAQNIGPCEGSAPYDTPTPALTAIGPMRS